MKRQLNIMYTLDVQSDFRFSQVVSTTLVKETIMYSKKMYALCSDTNKVQ